LGVNFYEMLTGEKPYHGSNAMSIIYKHGQEPVPKLPSRFARYQSVLDMMMAKQPKDRLQSVGELAQWL